MKSKKQERLVFLPLGGSGEIGMNMNLYGFGKSNKEKWIMIDCGVMFGSNETPGVNVIFPDYSFIKDKVNDLMAIILTHAHEDHIGAIAHIWPDLRVPIYATPFTSRIIQDKFNEYGIDASGFLQCVPRGTKLSIGDFRIEFINVTHSIPEPNGIYINTPTVSVYHTGDWKFDSEPVIGDVTDYKRLFEIAKNGVHACICDSTNAPDNHLSESEASILNPVKDLISNAKNGRVVITTFASNVARVKTLMNAASKSGRKVCLSGRSLEKIYAHGKCMNYFDGIPEPISMEDSKKIDKKDIAFICTGSQGEYMSSMGKISRGVHQFINLEKGDTVIFSSKVIPGNERAVFNLYNNLSERGVKIVTSKDANIHVSGHPTAPDLRKLYEILKPVSVIPVHGEMFHMEHHYKIALESGVSNSYIPKNGDLIEINHDNIICNNKIKAGKIYLDGKLYENNLNGSSLNRKRLNYAGYCSIVLLIDIDGKLHKDPVVQSFGVPSNKDLFGEDGEKVFTEAIKKIYSTQELEIKQSDNKISEEVRRGYRSLINKSWGKKPITDVRVIRI